MEENNEIQAFDADYSNFNKSNYLITSKYKASIIENKLMAISLQKLQKINPKSESLVCEIKASELADLINPGNKGSFYQYLDKAAVNLTGKTIGFRDPENNYFDYVSIITRCTYENGVLKIRYNDDCKEYLTEINKPFTRLSLPVLLSFSKSPYSQRLYEILKSKAYYPKDYMGEKNNIFSTTISIYELRFDLGVANANLPEVRAILQKKSEPDYKKAYDILPNTEKTYDRWRDFKIHVIDKAVEEVNEKSELSVSYEEIKGPHAKTESIKFIIKLDYAKNQTTKECSETQDDIIEQILELTGFKYKEVKEICEKSNYEIDRIKIAYDILKSQNKKIDSPVGFMISALENNWKLNKKSTDQETSFQNFKQRDYKDEELEDIYEN